MTLTKIVKFKSPPTSMTAPNLMSTKCSAHTVMLKLDGDKFDEWLVIYQQTPYNEFIKVL